MSRKKAPKQLLLNLYKEELAYHLQNKYTTHCTDGKRVVEAAQQAMSEEYKEGVEHFKKILDNVQIGVDR